MKKYLLTTAFLFILSNSAISQDSLTITLVENHKFWGWESWVMSNGLITIATVPEIGARVMQYDLGEHPSIFVNENELGNTYIPNPSQWPNFGGFKNWPAPQSEWNWPPPPTLDYGAYSAESDSSADSVSLIVTSPIEQWRAPNIRFKRKMSLFKNSSRVKVAQTIINEGPNTESWSIWDVTQQITNHPGETDFENFKVYFPINPASVYGDSGVRVSGDSDAWVGETYPGIYEVVYSPDSEKIFADSHIGWVAYVDERDGFVYAKSFDIYDGSDYPDEGARVEVWVQDNPYYLETEVLSPIVDLEPNGGEYTFTENWWSAKIDGGPVLELTDVGVVTKFELEDSGQLAGSFGVFHNGYARLEFYNSEELLDTLFTSSITPLEVYKFDEPVSFPPEADSVRVVILDPEQNYIGLLTSTSIDQLTTSIENDISTPFQFKLSQNYPNPFNPATKINFTVPQSTNVSLRVFDVLGREVSILVNEFKAAGYHSVSFDAKNLTSGVYFYTLSAGGFSQTNKMLLVK